MRYPLFIFIILTCCSCNQSREITEIEVRGSTEIQTFRYLNGQVAAQGAVTVHTRNIAPHHGDDTDCLQGYRRDSYRYENGEVMKERLQPCAQPWREYLRDGRWIYWYENGQKQAEVEYRIGTYTTCCTAGPCDQPYEEKVGLFSLWHTSGRLKATGEFAQKVQHIETSCEGGDRISVGIVPMSARFYDSDGVELSDSTQIEALREEIENL